MLLGRMLPAHHLNTDTKDVVRLGTGVIATMAALILGLLVASAKGTFDAMSDGLAESGGNIVLLDGLLLQYGSETEEARTELRRAVAASIEQVRSYQRTGERDRNAPTFVAGIESIQAILRELSPRSEGQRWLQSRALQITCDLTHTRWLLVQQAESSLPMPFLVVLVFWLSIIFSGFGLFAPRNAIVVATLFVCALSVACSIFLILEMSQPFGGVIHIPPALLRSTLEGLAR
jgi:hypothetical protein